MPINSSDLTRKFISNTYQRVLQTDLYTDVDTLQVATFSYAAAITGDGYTLLNGFGQKVQGLVIDHTQDGNAGLFIKHTIYDSGIWGAQIAEINSQVGFVFWRPPGSTNPNSSTMFLSNTGNLWVGYVDGGTSPYLIDSGFGNCNLNVKDGIHLEGDMSVSGNGFYVNEKKPIYMMRFSPEGQNSTSNTSYHGKFEIKGSAAGGGTLGVDWHCTVVGIYYSSDTSGSEIVDFAHWCHLIGGSWYCCFKFEHNGGKPHSYPLIDIMAINTSLVYDDRNMGTQSSNYYIPNTAVSGLPATY